MAKLHVNGKVVDYTAEEGTPLLWVLRRAYQWCTDALLCTACRDGQGDR